VLRLHGINTRPDSHEAFQSARDSLEHCRTSHLKCQSPGPGYTPRFLISIWKIDDAYHCRLQLCSTLGSAEAVSYATSSYCWGNAHQFRTTTSNLDRHLESIVFHQLPPTLQDAVVVTYKLGLRYLWIDAVCKSSLKEEYL